MPGINQINNVDNVNVVNNSTAGNSKYYAYGVFLMYHLKPQSGAVRYNVFTNLELAPNFVMKLDRIFKDQAENSEFTSKQIKSIESIFGHACRKLAANRTQQQLTDLLHGSINMQALPTTSIKPQLLHDKGSNSESPPLWPERHDIKLSLSPKTDSKRSIPSPASGTNDPIIKNIKNSGILNDFLNQLNNDEWSVQSTTEVGSDNKHRITPIEHQTTKSFDGLNLIADCDKKEVSGTLNKNALRKNLDQMAATFLGAYLLATGATQCPKIDEITITLTPADDKLKEDLKKAISTHIDHLNKNIKDDKNEKVDEVKEIEEQSNTLSH